MNYTEYLGDDSFEFYNVPDVDFKDVHISEFDVNEDYVTATEAFYIGQKMEGYELDYLNSEFAFEVLDRYEELKNQ